MPLLPRLVTDARWLIMGEITMWQVNPLLLREIRDFAKQDRNELMV